MNWADEYKLRIDEQIQTAGQHVVVIPSIGDDAPIDTVDVFDGGTHSFVATRVPEKAGFNFAILYNGMIDAKASIDEIRKVNFAWLSGVNERKTYIG